MYNSRHITVIIPAAGMGKRMQSAYGETRKQFILIHDKPILYYTLRPFHESELIDDIILVCEKEWIGYVQKEIIELYRFTKVKKIAEGGALRQDSVYKGLKAIDRADIVLVHDGVRPVISENKIREVIMAASDHNAAILAVKVKDTVKKQDADGFVAETLNREKLWNVQTPQCFEYQLLIQAFEKAYQEGFYGTDESMLVERLGVKVKIVEGEYENIKITTPEDVSFVENRIQKK
jgi:2-C-methyl-D-erythritol 4-phosphate cytidylyltransferase